MDVRHRWRPLDPAKNEIRLLTIEPASDECATLSCSLSTVSLDDDPVYDALSYTWGDRTQSVPIRLDGFLWEITTNLSDALLQLRQDPSRRRLFVDALCIDQHDLAEKSIQVPLMGRIYNQAQHAHCWLGTATADSGIAVEIFKQISLGIAMVDMIVHGRPTCDDDLRALLSFIMRPYWRRAWIVQELILPPQATLYCGEHRLDRDELTTVHVFLESLKGITDHILTSKHDAFVLLILLQASYPTLAGVSTTLYAKRNGGLHGMSCGQFRNLTKQLASVTHDHLYAFLGLLDPRLSCQIVPDYNEDVASVYWKFTFAWVVFRGRADLLDEAVGMKNNDLCLPSWTPDYSYTEDDLPPAGTYFEPNDQLLEPGFELTSDGLFGVRAFCLDHVIASRPLRSDGMSMITLGGRNPEALASASAYHREWRKFFNMRELPNDDDMYVGGGTLENAYWQTLGLESYYPGDTWDGDHEWLLQKHIDACKEWLTTSIESPAAASLPDIQSCAARFNRAVGVFEDGQLFRTSRGYIGMTLSKAPLQVNDSIFLIATTATASILRTARSDPRGMVYQLVSSGYVHGTMVRATERFQSKDFWEELPAIDFKTYTHPHMKLATSWEKIWLA